MLKSNTVFYIIGISIGLYWLLYMPFPEKCDYPIALRIVGAFTEGIKVLVRQFVSYVSLSSLMTLLSLRRQPTSY